MKRHIWDVSGAGLQRRFQSAGRPGKVGGRRVSYAQGFCIRWFGRRHFIFTWRGYVPSSAPNTGIVYSSEDLIG